MNKILKILSILIIGFVMFSCSTPTNDPTHYVPEESGPETPEVQTYSITFTTKDEKIDTKAAVICLNNLNDFKDLKEGEKVNLYKRLYCNEDFNKFTTEIIAETSVWKYYFTYHTNNPGVSLEYDSNSERYSVVIGNENVEIEVIYKECSKDLNN